MQNVTESSALGEPAQQRPQPERGKRRKRRPRRPYEIYVDFVPAKPKENACFGTMLRQIEALAGRHFDATGRWPRRVEISLYADLRHPWCYRVLEEWPAQGVAT